MIDLITKENSFYALYNEPFGDILKAFLIKSSTPALVGLVADAPAPVDKEVTQIAKNVIQFAVQKIEISGVKDDPRQIVSSMLNEIDRQLKAKQLTNGLLCCSVIMVYDHFLYIGGVGDCTIAISNPDGSLRFCHDGPDEPRPDGVENFSIAPAEVVGLSHSARLGDLQEPYNEEGVYQLEADPTMDIYMFSDGLTKHIPNFFTNLAGNRSSEVFERVNQDIPKEAESLLDDICFTVIKMPAELAPKQVKYPPNSNPVAMAVNSGGTPSAKSKKPGPQKSPKPKKQKSTGGCGFWVLFLMLLFIIALLGVFGYFAYTEWMTFKAQLSDILKSQ